jgi:hypothetical protein
MGSKPFLSPNQQVERLKSEKGVKFEICSESQAVEYLQNNNNYFRLGAYRKNYIKNFTGNNAGKYNNLDFAYLVDLAIIDLELRDVLMRMTLDVEHYTKLQLLRMIEQRYNDGCGIFISYYNSLSEKEQDRLKNDLFETQKSKYCEEIIKKYFTKNFPDDFYIWAFFEVISLWKFLEILRVL